MATYKVEVLQGVGAWWCGPIKGSHKTRGAADAEALRITAQNFTATRVVNHAGKVLMYSLPEYADVAYPPSLCAEACELVTKLQQA